MSSRGRADGAENLPIESVGRYRLEKLLGAGGMGAVYRGFDTELRRPVALKRVHPRRTDAHAVRRLRREARGVARLNHPAIAQIYDVLEEKGVLWIVFELVDGETMLALRQRAESPLPAMLRWFRQIAEGLSVAHRHGLLHRDLKHENVLVGRDDSTGNGSVGGEEDSDEDHSSGTQAKILDFGLVKSLEPDEAGEGESDLSKSGRLMGTSRSMSPEQVAGGPLDQRSDLFAFGVLIYEAIAGFSPFQDKTTVGTLQRVLTHTPRPLKELHPDLPAELSDLVESLLHKEAIGRPVDAAQVVRSLDAISAQVAEAPRPGGSGVGGAAATRRDTASVEDLESQSTLSGAFTPPLDPSETPGADQSGDRRSKIVGGLAASRRVRPWLRTLALVSVLVSALVFGLRGDSGQGAEGGARRDVVAVEDFTRLMDLRSRLRSSRGLDELHELEADIRVLETESPHLVEAPLLRSRLMRRRYQLTRDLADLEGALGAAVRARALAPEWILPIEHELEAALAFGQLERAEQLMDEIDRRSPGRLTKGPWRAWYLRLSGRGREALPLLRAALSTYTSPDFLYELAHLEISLGEYGAARGHLEALLELSPAHPNGKALLAQTEMLGGDLDRAAALYAELLENRKDVNSLSNLGVVYLLSGRFDEARGHFAAAVELAPAHPSLQLNLADALSALGEQVSAAEHYGETLRLQGAAVSEGDPQYWTIRAQALANLGRRDETLEAVEMALSLSEAPEIALEAAVVYAHLGDLDQVSHWLHQAVEIGGLSAVWERLPVFAAWRSLKEEAAAAGSPPGN